MRFMFVTSRRFEAANVFHAYV